VTVLSPIFSDEFHSNIYSPDKTETTISSTTVFKLLTLKSILVGVKEDERRFGPPRCIGSENGEEVSKGAIKKPRFAGKMVMKTTHVL